MPDPFQKQTLTSDARKADYVFELDWRRPERMAQPLDLLAALERRFQIKSFELTTDDGR